MQRARQTYAFGDFRLDARRRVLTVGTGGQPVALSGLAFDALLHLVADGVDVDIRILRLRVAHDDGRQRVQVRLAPVDGLRPRLAVVADRRRNVGRCGLCAG